MAVAARKLEAAQEFAKKHSIPRAYGSYEELARDPNVGEWPDLIGWWLFAFIWIVLSARCKRSAYFSHFSQSQVFAMRQTPTVRWTSTNLQFSLTHNSALSGLCVCVQMWYMLEWSIPTIWRLACSLRTPRRTCCVRSRWPWTPRRCGRSWPLPRRMASSSWRYGRSRPCSFHLQKHSQLGTSELDVHLLHFFLSVTEKEWQLLCDTTFNMILISVRNRCLSHYKLFSVYHVLKIKFLTYKLTVDDWIHQPTVSTLYTAADILNGFIMIFSGKIKSQKKTLSPWKWLDVITKWACKPLWIIQLIFWVDLRHWVEATAWRNTTHLKCNRMKCLPSFAPGYLDPVLPPLGGDQTAAGPAGGGRGEDGESGVWLSVGSRSENVREGAGRRNTARYWHLLPAVHMHGIWWREARVHPGQGDLPGVR